MTLPAIQYAVYPGSVTLRDGQVATFTAEELATAYGVDGEDYLVVADNTEIPPAPEFFNYIHLKPRADGVYQNIKTTAQDDDEEITYGENFDGDKKYTMETNRNIVDQDDDMIDT
jgi:hypothetical protein